MIDKFKNKVFEKMDAIKIPFFTILIIEISPEIFSTSLANSLVFWILYLISYIWVFSWLQTTWLTSSPVISEHKNPKIFSCVVRHVFFFQVKISIIGTLLVLPIMLLLAILYILIFSGNSNDITSLQMALLGQADILKIVQSLFLESIIFFGVPLIIVSVVYFRCGYIMFSLFRSDEKISLMKAWKKTKGTTLIALKLLTPLTIVTLLFTYIAISTYSSVLGVNVMLQIISNLIILPIFFQALTKYFSYFDK